ncbi:FHA domain-containing protein [Desulfovirgula thermocuniculi]|uniref:FHA domain-containing protein n=1 Tax=Desulfovirgula thermocuniculi TaxID=348842 RepID=UPI000413D986|nr:FHA domain-containing protein [Desulfovirgula thermocuniculi]
MLDLVLAVLRYAFLFLLYLFLWAALRMMFKGLAEAGKVSVPRTLPSEGWLVVLSSNNPRFREGEVITLGERLTMGRGEKNDLVLPDPFSSHEHAEVFFRNGQYWVRDLGSKNGTYLNGVRITRPTVLADGDSLRVGSVTFRFVRWAYELEPGQR